MKKSFNNKEKWEKKELQQIKATKLTMLFIKWKNCVSLNEICILIMKLLINVWKWKSK
jgi:hypothetical protein